MRECLTWRETAELIADSISPRPCRHIERADTLDMLFFLR